MTFTLDGSGRFPNNMVLIAAANQPIDWPKNIQIATSIVFLNLILSLHNLYMIIIRNNTFQKDIQNRLMMLEYNTSSDIME